MDRHFSPELRLFSVSWLFSVGIFMMNDRDFHNEQSRFSWWTIEIFVMNGENFQWQNVTFIMTDPEMLIALAKMQLLWETAQLLVTHASVTYVLYEFFFLLQV